MMLAIKANLHTKQYIYSYSWRNQTVV